jgi:hypothetical protein
MPLVTKKVIRLSDVAERSVEWLWPERLPLGKLTLVDGDPDQGKSLLVLDLAARLSAGRPLPDGFVPEKPCSVVILAREDDLDDTIVPRLRAAGADLSRIHLLKARIESNGTSLPIAFPRDCELLKETLVETEARLAVIDPFVAFLDARVSCLNEQMARRALDPLAQVGREMRATIQMVRHLTKRSWSLSAIHRGIGAVGILGLARTAFLIGRDAADSSLRLFAANKNNLGPLAPTLAYRVRTSPEGLPVIEWDGVRPITAEQLVLESCGRFGDTVERAVAFLQEALGSELRPSNEIFEEAAAQDISRRTLRRAKDHLHVASAQIREHGRNAWYWRIPAAPTPEEECALLLQELRAPPENHENTKEAKHETKEPSTE